MQYFTEGFDPLEYDGMVDLSGNEGTTLMAHNITGRQIIRKSISGANVELYRQLASIHHENLVQIFGLQATASYCYTYEEYINGQTLTELIANGPVPEETALNWIGQLCSAVRILHKQNPVIIHRDIKPGNIMLTSNGVIKLIDFDAAKEFTPDKHQDTELMGTPMYAAPEQYGFATSDTRTDIYAIGILFHELLTGYKPSESKTPYKGRYKAIIQSCIELDPARRYKSVLELERQLGLRGINRVIGVIPGFRTGAWWKKIIAVVLYFAAAIIAVSLVYEDPTFLLLGFYITLSVPPYLLITNPLRIREKLPLLRSKSIPTKIAGYALYLVIWFLSCAFVGANYLDSDNMSAQEQQQPVTTVEEARELLQSWLDNHPFDSPVTINDALTHEDERGFNFVLYQNEEFARIRVVKRNGTLLRAIPDSENFNFIDDWYH